MTGIELGTTTYHSIDRLLDNRIPTDYPVVLVARAKFSIVYQRSLFAAIPPLSPVSLCKNQMPPCGRTVLCHLSILHIVVWTVTYHNLEKIGNEIRLVFMLHRTDRYNCIDTFGCHFGAMCALLVKCWMHLSNMCSCSIYVDTNKTYPRSLSSKFKILIGCVARIAKANSELFNLHLLLMLLLANTGIAVTCVSRRLSYIQLIFIHFTSETNNKMCLAQDVNCRRRRSSLVKSTWM